MRASLVIAAALLLILGALTLIRVGTRQETLIAGGMLVVVGVSFLIVARRQLGSAFSVVLEAKGLVMNGLYSKIPHPMYVFLDLALVGAVLVLQQAWLLPLVVVLVGVQAWQARRESAVLAAAFGDAYREYRKRTLW